MKNIPVIGFVAILMLLSIETHAFWNFYKRIDSIKVLIDDTQLSLPGESFEIEVVAYFKNGNVKSTENFIHKAVPWHKFKVEVTGGNFSMGKIHVNPQLVPSVGKFIKVEVYPRKGDKHKKSLLLPLHYEKQIRIVPTSNVVKAPGFGFKFQIQLVFNNGVISE
ncbi:MAG: hypothetical protein K9G70_15080 [Prolixibacteraceae bacterium]|nr:hypothetical protein [Prolixibacteraceae bacterium]